MLTDSQHIEAHKKTAATCSQVAAVLMTRLLQAVTPA